MTKQGINQSSNYKKHSFLEKLTVPHIVKKFQKFPAFYGTRRFNTTFTAARHLSLSWARSIHLKPSHSTILTSIATLNFHLRPGLPSGLFSLRFPHQNPECNLSSTPHVLHASPITSFIISLSELYLVILTIAKLLIMHFSPFSLYFPPPTEA